jgi:tRNA-splicing ligase RtcB
VITIRGDVEANAVAQLEACARASGAPFAAQMADGHLGYGLSIGGVLGLRDYISPDAVGYDIGCGNKAVKTDLRTGDVRTDTAAIMDEIFKQIDFGAHRGQEKPEHPILDEIAASELSPQREMADKARQQLGTVGGGNHYVDLFSDEDDWLWVGVHFGSRGFGHTTATEYLKRSASDAPPFGEKPPISLIPLGTELAAHYLEAMRLAGAYAHAGRDLVVEKVLKILGAEAVEDIHNHHNYAWREDHNGEALWVIRKGATPAFPGQRGFVGATMGEPSVILEGIESPGARDLLYSTVHGAGRVMSRSEAAGKQRKRWICGNRDCEWVQPPHTHKPEGGCPLCGHSRLLKRWVQLSEGKVNFAEVKFRIADKGIELRGAGADEAPEAYKVLSEVLAYHSDTIRVLHTLTPIGVAMAGPGVPADD